MSMIDENKTLEEREILTIQKINCDNMNFSIGKHEYPFIDILTQIPYTLGDVIELQLDGIDFDWNRPDLALFIKSRRIIDALKPLNETRTSLFSLDLVIKYEERKKKGHKITYRTFFRNNEHLTPEQLRVVNRISGSIEYTFIKNDEADDHIQRIKRVREGLYSTNDKKVLQMLEDEGYK